jgi:FixJ family two-component response regulator
MQGINSSVLAIEDDVELRNSLGRRSVGLDARLFGSVSEFLKSNAPNGPACLVLDVRLLGQSGLNFQRELAAADREIPIVFITAHGGIRMSVQAMKEGAIEFLPSRSVMTNCSTPFISVSLAIVRAGRAKRLWPQLKSASDR